MNDPFDLIRPAEVLLADFMSVKAKESVLITADTATDRSVVAALVAQAERIGAQPVVMTAPRLPLQGLLGDSFISKVQATAMKSCDVWIDLAYPHFAGSSALDEAMKSGHVRYLLCGDIAAGSFRRLFGMIDLDAYFDAQNSFDDVFNAAIGKPCRVTTPNGTDITFTLAKPGYAKPRHAEKPGMYLIPGTCTIAPQVETVRGTIVIVATVHEFYELVPSTIKLTVDGQISKISGGGSSRVTLDRALKRASRGAYGSIIHLTHGLHPAARMTGKSFIEDLRTIGSNAVGFGIPWWEPGGGENHPNGLLVEQSIWLDGKKIIEDGVIVSPAHLADKARRLAPVGYPGAEGALQNGA